MKFAINSAIFLMLMHSTALVAIERHPSPADQNMGDLLTAKAKTALMSALAADYLEVSANVITNLNNVKGTPNDYTTRFTPTHPVSKRLCVWLVPKAHKTPSIPVWFRVTAKALVWETTRKLRARRIITNQDVHQVLKNTAGLREQPLKKRPQGRWLRVPLEPHQTLMAHHTTIAPVIKKGHSCQIIAHHGRITVTMDAIALSNGAMGETLLFKNPLSQKTLTAIVRGPNQAEASS